MVAVTRTKSPLEQYERYRPLIKTGDVIGFSGTIGLSPVIKWVTGSVYSHVGIVLNAEMSGGLGNSVLLVESTVETRIRDAMNSEVIKGVQLHWLSKRIQMYQGGVWWASLKKPLAKNAQERMQGWLRQTHNQCVPYDAVQIMGAGLDIFDRMGVLKNKESFSTLFCSELVTKALQIGGAIDPKLNASEQTPGDVMAFPCLEQALPLKYR
jgi:hypothetical protein